MFEHWPQQTARHHGPRKLVSTRRRPRRCRPGLEVLEDRAVPALLTVNSLQDLAVDLSDTTVTLRDAIDAANHDMAVAPGGPTGSGADTITFDPSLFAG